MPFHEMRSPLVFVPNKSFHDFSDARRYGEIVYLTEGQQERFRINDQYRRISRIMADAQIGDYLLISGPATVNAIAASILAHRFGRINYLIYAGERYISRPVVLSEKEGMDGSEVKSRTAAG